MEVRGRRDCAARADRYQLVRPVQLCRRLELLGRAFVERPACRSRNCHGKDFGYAQSPQCGHGRGNGYGCDGLCFLQLKCRPLLDLALLRMRRFPNAWVWTGSLNDSWNLHGPHSSRFRRLESTIDSRSRFRVGPTAPTAAWWCTASDNDHTSNTTGRISHRCLAIFAGRGPK